MLYACVIFARCLFDVCLMFARSCKHPISYIRRTAAYQIDTGPDVLIDFQNHSVFSSNDKISMLLLLRVRWLL